MMIRNKTKENSRGITLVALIITIIILIILAAVTIMTIYDNNFIGVAINATEKYAEEQYREMNMLDSLNSKLEEAVDKIEMQGKINENIVIKVDKIVSEDGLKVILNIKVEYQGKIQEIKVNGENISVPNENSGVNIIEKEIEENGMYTIIVKDEEGNYNIVKIKVNDLFGDMEIWDKEDMILLRQRVNEGKVLASTTIKVMDNIDLECTQEDKWEAIGSTENPFLGTFEGNNHSLKGLYMEGTEVTQGLFSYNSGTIKNIKIENGYVKSSNVDTGMVAGVNAGRIENVTTSGEIVAERNTGGITGRNLAGAVIDNCVNNSDINKDKDSSKLYSTDGYYMGGIVGTNSGEVKNTLNYGYIQGRQYIGGIVGANGTVTNSGNEGNVRSLYGYSGGISGSDSIVTACYNKGDITALNSSIEDSGYSSTGGIQGRAGLTTYSYNRGKVHAGAKQAGGINGNLYNKGSDRIKNCYNTGTVEGLGRVGSIVGQCAGASYTNCWWTTSNAGSGNSRFVI